MRLKVLVLWILVVVSIGAHPRKSNAATDDHYTSVYLGTHLDRYQDTPDRGMKVSSSVEEVDRLRREHAIQVIYLDASMMVKDYAAQYAAWYTDGIMLVALDAPMSTFSSLLARKTIIPDSAVDRSSLLASMVYTDERPGIAGMQSEFSTYFRSFDALKTVVTTLLTEYQTPQAPPLNQLFAASISKPDGQGGYLNGSSWLSGSTDFYARGFTSRTPSAAYYNTVTVTGSTNCGGAWHPITTNSAYAIYGSVQTVSLAGSTQCPDPPATGLKNRSSSTHSIQVQSGGGWIYGSTEMTLP